MAVRRRGRTINDLISKKIITPVQGQNAVLHSNVIRDFLTHKAGFNVDALRHASVPEDLIEILRKHRNGE